jgi:hypothetical protein
MDLQTAHGKFRERIEDIKEFCSTESPLVFVLASAYLDYLAKLSSKGYKDFIIERLSKVRPGYKSFRFRCGEADLPVQMYHVLRCGILHSFSLIPDEVARERGGRDGSIVLFHRKGSQERGFSHLSNYADSKAAAFSSTVITSGSFSHLSNHTDSETSDAAVFVAEDFVEDIEKVMEMLFAEAENNPRLKASMETWLQQHPLITGSP